MVNASAVIEKRAMRSDPDVHPLGMMDWGATDLTSLCLCKHLFSHQLLSNTGKQHAIVC